MQILVYWQKCAHLEHAPLGNANVYCVGRCKYYYITRERQSGFCLNSFFSILSPRTNSSPNLKQIDQQVPMLGSDLVIYPTFWCAWSCYVCCVKFAKVWLAIICPATWSRAASGGLIEDMSFARVGLMPHTGAPVDWASTKRADPWKRYQSSQLLARK